MSEQWIGLKGTEAVVRRKTKPLTQSHRGRRIHITSGGRSDSHEFTPSPYHPSHRGPSC
jgi:hypothetical protein